MKDIGRDNKEKRIEWIEKAIQQIPEGLRILDAGAGELANKKFCKHLDYVSQDFAQYNGKNAPEGLQNDKWDTSRVDIICDITSIPEQDKSFDAVMCTEVFEHLPNPFLALKEFSRLLRSGGILIITAPFCSLTHQAPYHFSTGFNRYYYEKHLTDLGFEVIELETNGNYFSCLAQELRRVRSVALRYSNDKPRKWESLAIRILINMLFRFSEKDIGSDELLCFGYNIIAKKI